MIAEKILWGLKLCRNGDSMLGCLYRSPHVTVPKKYLEILGGPRVFQSSSNICSSLFCLRVD